MAQTTIIKPIPSQALLSFNMQNIDQLFPGFALGDFGVIYGSPDVLPMSLLLAVRAQLPHQLGGLESNVIFVDGGNTFKLYMTSRIAQTHSLNPRQVLQRIFISRAFTAHQMTSIILDKLEETTTKHNAKLAIISDLTALYLDKDIPADESKEVFNQVAAHLSKLTEQKGLITLATCPPHEPSRRKAFFHAIASARANITIRLTKERAHQSAPRFILEKHPLLKPGTAEFPSESSTLDCFLKGVC